MIEITCLAGLSGGGRRDDSIAKGPTLREIVKQAIEKYTFTPGNEPPLWESKAPRPEGVNVYLFSVKGKACPVAPTRASYALMPKEGEAVCVVVCNPRRDDPSFWPI